MESLMLLGLIIRVSLVWLVAMPLFCIILIKLIKPDPRLSHVVFYLSKASFGLFCVALLLVTTLGVSGVVALKLDGPIAFVLFFNILGSAPALACVLLLGHRNFARWWPAVAAICCLVGIFSFIYLLHFAETFNHLEDDQKIEKINSSYGHAKHVFIEQTQCIKCH